MSKYKKGDMVMIQTSPKGSYYWGSDLNKYLGSILEVEYAKEDCSDTSYGLWVNEAYPIEFFEDEIIGKVIDDNILVKEEC